MASSSLDPLLPKDLRDAVIRNSGTADDLKHLATGDTFAKILPVLRGYGEVVPTNHLELLQNTTMIHGLPLGFVPKEKFVKDTNSLAKVKIESLSRNFTTWFLSGSKREDHPTRSMLYSYRILKLSKDMEIIRELCREGADEVKLVEIFSLLEKQGDGQKEGALSVEHGNVFYSQSAKDLTRAILVDWGNVGWCISSQETETEMRWRPDFRVFSHNLIINGKRF